MSLGIFISDINGKEVEVTDPKAALAQCREAVLWHEQTKAEWEKDSTVLYFKDAHANWQHKLLQMEKMTVKSPNLFI